MKTALYCLILLFGVAGAMEDLGRGKEAEGSSEVSEAEYMPVHIEKLQGFISLVGCDVESAVVLEFLLDYMNENSLKFESLWYEKDDKWRHFIFDILKLSDNEFIEAFMEKFPTALRTEFFYERGSITVDDILVSAWQRSKPRSDEKRRIQLLVNKLRNIKKDQRRCKIRGGVIKSTPPILFSTTRSEYSLVAKASSVSPARLTLYTSDEHDTCRRPLIKLIKEETASIKMVYRELSDSEVAGALSQARDNGVAVTLILNSMLVDEEVKDLLSAIKVKIYKGKRPMALNFALFEKLKTCAHGTWFPSHPDEEWFSAMSVERNAVNRLEHFKKVYKICKKQSEETVSSSSSQLWDS